MSTKRKNRKSLRLGLPIVCKDGKAGKVTRIVVERETRQPLYLAASLGRLHRKEVVVPVTYVRQVTARSVELELTRAALAEFPQYEITVKEGRYEKPFPRGRRPFDVYIPPSNRTYTSVRQRSVPEQSIAIKKGLRLLDQNHQEVDRVEGMVFDPGHQQGKYLVFRRDNFSALQVAPAELVKESNSNAVKLGIDWQQVEALPFYTG